MKKNSIIIVGILVVSVIGYLLMGNSSSEEMDDLFVKVKKGEFQISVTTTGELEAKNSVKIFGPDGMRRANIWQTKIEHIIEEGKEVKKGDYIARLDKTELMDKINQSNDKMQEYLSKLTQAKMDTALELRKARDELVNLEYDVEEKQIEVDGAKFEPAAIQRKSEIEFQKAERKLKQMKENYDLQYRKAKAQVNQAASEVSQAKRQFDFSQELLNDFTITAPEDGMLIYRRDWRGQKMGVGAEISPWNSIVAELPDLTKMVSKTYVNEIDIRTVKKGQTVKIGLDAYPDKVLTGDVVEVANVGEQKPNSESKVFLVLVQIHESDTTLRPSMTTSNTIIADVILDATYLPLEAVHSQGDSISYVVKSEGGSMIKQQVLLGKENSNEVIIEKGVEEGESVYLSIPEGLDNLKMALLEEDETITDSTK